MKQKSFFLIILLVFSSNILFGQEGYFQLRGRIYNKSKESLNDVKIEVFEDSRSIDSNKTSQQGVFSLRFKLNKAFTVEIRKRGYATKRIIVNTEVPEDKIRDFFDLFNLIILDDIDNADIRSKNGLPVSKYYYKESIGDFIGEKITDQVVAVNRVSSAKLKELQEELNNYKALVEQQKKMLKEAESIVLDANLIKAKAKLYSDSVIAAAEKKKLNILNYTSQDTTKKEISALDKTTKEVTKEDFENLAVDEKTFQNNKKIQKLQVRVKELTSQKKKTGWDSLQIKRDRLSIRKELFDLAKYQLEIDRLNARTKEDSLRIEKRESELYFMEQEMKLADEEIKNARNELKLKDLVIKNKNIMILSFVIGSILLLILLGIIYYNYRDKKRINKILEFQNQELEKLSIVASETSNAVVITNENGKYIWVNKGYTRLFGYSQEEVTGNNPRSMINSENGDEINQLINQALTNGQVVNYEFETESKEGKKIWVQTTVTPILDNEGKVSKMIVIDSDISKIKEAEFEILNQSRLLAKQNAQIMDSINYGKRIQDAILPSESLIKSYFPDSFIYFRPRDIVSGDFYWFSVQEDQLFVAAVDCTGHGVPGAFMSLIGNSLLNHIVNERKIYKPSDILKELNWGVNSALSQSKSENDEHEDGMDLTICCFDKNKMEVQIACANHTALIVKENDVHEIEGDGISIGEVFSKNDEIEFTNYIVPFVENSTMYLFSDGYQDQIGGPKNKKFLVTNFKNFLLENQGNSMELQFDKLNEEFQKWKGNNKQTDDVLVMGIRLNLVN